MNKVDFGKPFSLDDFFVGGEDAICYYLSGLAPQSNASMGERKTDIIYFHAVELCDSWSEFFSKLEA